MVDASVYTVGGTVQANDRGLYIPRSADTELLELCRRSTFAYVLTPRQMGKSSLMIRTAEQLMDEGAQVVIIDLTQIGTQLTAEQWYQGLLTLMAQQLELTVEIADWWQAQAHLGLTQRLTQFFQRVVLTEVRSPVVMFVDEIDTTLSLTFTDDFFAAIRYFYVTRAMQPEFQRLSFVLIGVATPGDLIQDAKRTPFNIGQRVDLTDFTLKEALPLATGLELTGAAAEQVLGWVLQWTGGHPYLTQRLCQEMARVGGSGWTATEVERLMRRTFLGTQSEQDNNLQFVRNMLTQGAEERGVEAVPVLQTYRQIRRDKPAVVDEEQSLVKSHLKLAGVVKREGKTLRVRNRIYRQVFDRAWIREHLPENWWQRLKPAMPIIATLLVAFIGMTGFAVLANQQRVIADQERISAVDARRQLEVALSQANEQTLVAQAAQKEARIAQSAAVTQKSRATQAVEAETKQRQNAEQQAQNAKNQTRIATEQRQRAEAQTQRAERETVTANEQRRLAALQAQIANDNAQEANRQKQDANYQTTVANLRGQAAKALYLLTTRPVEGMVLAIQATGKSRQESVKQAFDPVDDSLLSAVQGVREQNAFQGHTASVRSVAFSPDGQRIVSGSRDSTVRLWDLQGKPIGQPFQGHTESVRSVAFSPDGQRIVSGSGDKTVRLWDLQGKPIGQPFEGHTDDVYSVAFSPDGQRIVSGSSDKTVRLWLGDWYGWLWAACTQLREHSVLRDPDNSFEPAVARGARQICEREVWGKSTKLKM